MSDLIINIEKKTRKVELSQVYLGNDHENLQENLVFTFDEFVNGQARLEYEIEGNKNYIILTKENETYTIPVKNVITIYQEETEGKIQFQLVITEGTNEEEIPVFKSNIFYLRCRPSINAVTEAPEGYELWIEQANAKLNLIDEKLEDMSEALEDVNTAITEVNNLDLDANKVNKTTTVSLTKKDGTTKTVQIADGLSLEFLWQGTSLGIRVEGQGDYTFVDLQGIQGPIGPQGEAFQIKKTYSSVAEMNADFNNMQLGDYVMIASTVELEDNAKLYTRGESQWIFISDFSGAQGIRGPVGATPNISIGTVVSGDTPNVTRSGTDENPVLNFTLVKGDKGDTGNTGATGNGISSVEVVAETSSDKTLRINFTDGTYFDFTLENGEVTQAQLDEVIELNDRLLANTPTGTTNTNPAYMNDSADLPLNKFILKGKTEQFSTTGKNLMPLKYYNATEQRKKDFNIDLPINTYTISYDLISYALGTETSFSLSLALVPNEGDIFSVSAIIIDANTTLGKKSVTFTTTDNITINANVSYFSISSAKYNNGARVFIDNIQIEQGSTATAYEPYTNGASPNPSYPQEIENVEGPNKFDISKVVSNSSVVNNNDGTLTINVGSGSSAVSASSPYTLKDYCPKLKVGDEVYLKADTTGSTKSIYLSGSNSTWMFGTKRTITQNDLESRVFWYASGLNTSATVYNIMISKENKPYVPYNCIQIKKWNRNWFDNNKTPNILSSVTITKIDTGIKVTTNLASDYTSALFVITDLKRYIGKTIRMKADWVRSGNNTANYYIAFCKSDGSSSTNKVGSGGTSGNEISFVVPEFTDDKTYLGIALYGNLGASCNIGDYVEYKNIVVTIDNSDLTYIPHEEKIYYFPLSEGQFLAEDGTIENKIVNTQNQIVLDGVTDGRKVSVVGLNSSTGLYYCQCNNVFTDGKAVGSYNVDSLLCTHFKAIGGVAVGQCYRTGTNGVIFLFVLVDQTITTAEQANAWLAQQLTNGTPVEIEYPLATPDETVFTPEQQAVYNEIIKDGTYDEVTHYTAEASINPDMEIGYYKDLEIWVNNLLNS